MFFRTKAPENEEDQGRVQGQELGLAVEVPAIEVLERGRGFLVNFSMAMEGVMVLGPDMLKTRNQPIHRRPGKRDTKGK
jgi:hypothetical protein